jgi:gliding motility-associated-like protein
MTNYTWSVSPGGTVTSGGTSSSDNVVVTWNTAGLQDVAVNYTDANGCTAEVPAILTVSVQSLPVPTIIGPVSPCIFSDDNIYTTESGMTDYAWNVSSGGLITAGQGTDSVIVKWETAGQQYVSVNYTDQNGCTATESVYYDVTVRPLPDTASGIYGPSVICSPADSLYYSVAPIANAASYVWIMPQDFSVISGSGTSSVTVKVEAGASGGNIYVYGINVCGNGFHSPLFNVVVNNQALANAGPDQATCSGVPFTVSGAIASNYIDIHWISNGTGTLINSSSLSPTYSEGPNETGTVTLSLIATGESPCSNDTSRMILTILSSATVNAGDDLSSCKSSPVVLSDASASAYISLLWTTSGNGIFENPASLNTKYFPGDQDSQTGHVILTLQAYSASPCEPVSDSLTLTLVPGPEVTQGRDSIICQGMSYTVNGIYVNHSSGFYWFTSGHGDFNNTNTLNPTYIPAPDETGSIRLTLNVNGIAACHDSIVKSYTDFFIYPAPLVNAGEDQTIPYDNATSLTCAVSGGSGRYKYIWNPSSLLLDNSLQYPQTISLTKETVFYIIVTDQLTGCSTSDSTWVKVKPQNESEDCIVIHNVITPNGDGLNDTWDIDCIEIFPENSVRIFNRWGDVVNTFENYNNKDIVWEGTNSKGEILPDGTYFYLLNIKNGTTHTGWVFLHSGNR